MLTVTPTHENDAMAMTARPYLQRVELQEVPDSDYHAYPFNIPAVREMSNIQFHADVTFFVGENGAGKSTVLEAIAMALGFAPEGGTRNTMLSTTDSVSPLHRSLRLVKGFRQPRDRYFLRAESLFNVATYLDNMPESPGYGGKKLHARSHGELFLAVLVEQLRATACTCSTSRKRPCRRSASSLPSRRSTSWWAANRNSSSPHTHRSCWPTQTRASCCSTAPALRKWRTRTPNTSPSRAIF
jgi:hypothetical protein